MMGGETGKELKTVKINFVIYIQFNLLLCLQNTEGYIAKYDVGYFHNPSLGHKIKFLL